MSLNVGKEVAVLERMTVRELKERYAELFGEETLTHNRAWLELCWRWKPLGSRGPMPIGIGSSNSAH